MATPSPETLERPEIASGKLGLIDPRKPHAFISPIKQIHEGHDVPSFLTSLAYRDIGVFIMQLNTAMCPRKVAGSDKAQAWKLDSPIVLSDPVQKLQELLQKIDAIIEEAPPDTGPRRFGNVSFRRWYEILASRIEQLLITYLPASVSGFAGISSSGPSAVEELTPYILGAFGSSQRLDYGTGHELSFLAFLGCIWKLGGFGGREPHDWELERTIVIGVIEPYLRVVRHLILTYTLEPAGSHGVWGLDDHSFISYILGSSQYCPAITGNESMPVEGALPGSPDPGDVAKKNVVDKERVHNMYFSAVGFINDVKTGPFWEHSPMLFDISGVRSGWGKINKGMIKMYNAEVLSKFPVVQHFPFGSLFSWEQDPEAKPGTATVHTSAQPIRSTPSMGLHTSQTPLQESTKAPWAMATPTDRGPTKAPWGPPPTSTSRGAPQVTTAPWAKPTSGEAEATRVIPSLQDFRRGKKVPGEH